MILALDVGNTNIVIGCIDAHKIHFVGRLSTDKNKTELEYAVMFKNILDIHGISEKELDGAVISSVVPPLITILNEAVRTVTGHIPLVVNDQINTCIKIDMDDRKQIGNDLIVDAVAALSEHKPPLIIFDMGTATTISVVDRTGTYIGTIIIPGVKISQEALSGQTSLLPSITPEVSPHVISKNTIDSMKSGMIYGNASMMDGMIDRIEQELGEKATVIATGGLANCIVNHCTHDIIYDDDLILKGLWIIYTKNNPQ